MLALFAFLTLMWSQAAVAAPGAPAAASPYVDAAATFSMEYSSDWEPDPTDAEHGQLVLQCNARCGSGVAVLTVAEAPAPPAVTVASLPALSAAYWSQLKAKAMIPYTLQTVANEPVRLGGAPAHESRIDRVMMDGRRIRHSATFALRRGMLIRIEFTAPLGMWSVVERSARAVLASVRWRADLLVLLDSADRLRRKGHTAEALKLYTSPELAGHAGSMYYAGLIQVDDPQDHVAMAAGVRKLQQAVLHGHLSAGNTLAVTLLDTAERQKSELSPDFCDAIAFGFDNAIRSPDAVDALLYIGHLHRRGTCNDKNPERAISFYERAARAGNRTAAAELAAMFKAGKEVPPDLQKADYWQRVAMGASKP